MGQYPYGIKNMLKTTNLKQIGNIHSGIGEINIFFFFIYYNLNFLILDDCANIISIMNDLARRGCVFNATNKLVNKT